MEKLKLNLILTEQMNQRTIKPESKDVNEDQEMISVTPYSNWELLNPNDNPSDRFNCFIATAAGLLGLQSVKKFHVNSNLSEFVKSENTKIIE
jgi:hypothetical protein